MTRYIRKNYELETLNKGRPIRETRAQLGKVADLFRDNAGLALAKRDAVIPVDGNYLGYTCGGRLASSPMSRIDEREPGIKLSDPPAASRRVFACRDVFKRSVRDA